LIGATIYLRFYLKSLEHLVIQRFFVLKDNYKVIYYFALDDFIDRVVIENIQPPLIKLMRFDLQENQKLNYAWQLFFKLNAKTKKTKQSQLLKIQHAKIRAKLESHWIENVYDEMELLGFNS
jgi:DNA polymerase-3 subunit alpha